MSQFEVAMANLIEITKLKGGMLGKVDFQKTVYLAKDLGVYFPFEFRWDKFGPYSYELAHFMNQLLAKGAFRIDGGTYRVNSENPDIGQLGSCTTIDSATRKRLISLFRSIRQTVREKSFHIPTFMECLGSLLFIKASSGRADRSRIFDILRLLKFDRIDELSPMVDEAWSLLERNGL